MKKYNYILAMMLLVSPVAMGQNIVTPDDEDEDDEIVVVEEEESLSDSLVSKQKSNKIEVINANGVDFDVPEGLTSEIDSLYNLFHIQKFLRPAEDCNFPNINPEYSPEVYQARLQRLPTTMEMPYNNVVQTFIDRYSGRLRHAVSVMLGAANFYTPIFEEALEAYGLPLELKYLPVIESGLNPKATSRVGAGGLWQFMIGTGKQYGLEVNTLVDERRDPIKSSWAAAHYLSDLYKIFGDWSLVLAAYNCGPGNVNKAIHRSGGIKDFWQIYPYLPHETRGYVPAFIAANYIMNYYCEHNICPMITTLPSATDTIMVNRDVHFEQIAGVLGIEVGEIEMLNPQYRHQVVNGGTKPSALRLKSNDILAFIDNQDSIYAYRADELLTKRNTVAVNENYSSSKRGRGKSSRNKRGGRSVTVRSGDTLSAIAKRNGTTVAKLRKLNGISGNNIRAGKKIRVR